MIAALPEPRYSFLNSIVLNSVSFSIKELILFLLSNFFIMSFSGYSCNDVIVLLVINVIVILSL